MNYWNGHQDNFKPQKRCYNDHKPMPLKNGLVIYGGSCSTPIIKDADIYIGFDYSMKFTKKHYPWVDGAEIFMHVQDRSVPKSVGDFQKLIDFTIENLEKGKKIHVGCIGGHGRTGTFFAALVAQFMGVEDSITYVRDNYCKKAVESDEQVAWLHQYFGVKKVDGTDKHKPKKYKNELTTMSRVVPVKSKNCIFDGWV